MQFDPNATVKIRRSVVPLFCWFVVSALLATFGAFVSYEVVTSGGISVKHGLMGMFFLLGFGAFALLNLKRLWNAVDPVVLIGPDGFHDKRLFSQPIPWNVVQNIYVRKHGFSQFLFIEVTEYKYIVPKYIDWLKRWQRYHGEGEYFYWIGGLAFETRLLEPLLRAYAITWNSGSAKKHPSALSVVDRHFPPVC